MNPPGRTPDRDPTGPVFASRRPGSARRDATGWVPLHRASQSLTTRARQLRGTVTKAAAAEPAAEGPR